MPTCRMPPPQRLRTRRARRTVAEGPTRIDPTGAPSPFEKHIITVSAWAAQAAIGTPLAAAAFHSRAPSRWTRTPSERAALAPHDAREAAGIRRDAALLVTENVRVGLQQHLVAALGVHVDRELIAHRPARHEQRRLVPGELR